MEKNFTEQLTIKQLSSNANMSESSYRHNFKNIIGCSPIQYLNRIRLKNAATLLYIGKNIPEACNGSGFNDLGDFRKKFRKYFGVVPSEIYKLRIRGADEFQKLLAKIDTW